MTGSFQRLPWRTGTVAAIRQETPRAASFRLAVPDWPRHRAGQHLDLRLTAPDGYQAQRSYSIASAPGMDGIEITVERVPSGEVSPFLLDEVVVGDTLELRGPIGGYFTWEAGEGGPLQLVAGGSGVAPLMAMLRHRAKSGDRTPARLLYSSRTYREIVYREELDSLSGGGQGVEITHTLTREQPPGWTGEQRRIDRTMLASAGFPASARPRAYICGPTPLVEQVAADLVSLGYPEALVKTERFGPTGDPQ